MNAERGKADMLPEEALCLEYAKAVAVRNRPAMYLDAQNRKDGFERCLKKAVESGKPFAIQVRPELLAFDIDQADGEAATHRVKMRLEAAGSKCLAFRSGREGHVHLWCPIRSHTEIERVGAAVRAELSVNKPRRYIRPPMSPHRHGLAASLLFPPTHSEALRTLAEGRVPLRASEQAEAWRRRELQQGWPIEERSDGLIGLARYYVRYGLSAEQFIEDILANPAGAGEKSKGRLHESEFLREQYRSAETWLRAHPEAWNTSASHKSEIEHWAATAEKATKRNRRALASTVRAIALLAINAGRLTLHLSVRDLSCESGLAYATCARHIQCLASMGFLGRTRKSDGAGAAEYRLTLKKATNDTLRHHTPVCEIGERVFQLMPYVSEALMGRHARQNVLIELIRRGEATAEELAETLGRKPDTIRKHLEGLRSEGAAKRSHRVWYPTVDEDTLGRIAVESARSYGYAERTRINRLQQDNWRSRPADRF